MPTVWTEVEMDVELSDFEDDDLLEEITSRGLNAASAGNVQEIYDAYILKQPEVVDRLLRDLFYDTLGRIA